MNPLAIVSELYVHPVKSMTGQRLQNAFVEPYGLYGDRSRGLVRKDQPERFVTITQLPLLAAYRAEHDYTGMAEPRKADEPWAPVTITTPEGEACRWEDDRWLQDLEARCGMELMRWEAPHGQVPKGAIEDGDLLLTSEQGLAALELEYGQPLDLRRFRPNIHVRLNADANQAFGEHAWENRILRIGNAVLRVDTGCPRCSIVNAEPLTGRKDPGVLKSVVKRNHNLFGMFVYVIEPGLIQTGDTVWLQ